MSELTKKLLVVVIGCGLTGGVIFWRVQAMRAEAGGHDQHPHFDPVVERLAPSPSGLPGSGIPECQLPIAKLNAVKLGTVTYFHDADELASLEAACRTPIHVRRAHNSLDGNAYLVRSLEVDLPDYPKGTGKQISDVYFVTTGPLPSRLNPVIGSMWPVVTNVFAGKPAELGGLRVGDVVLTVDDVSAQKASPTELTKAAPVGQVVTLAVARNGEETTVAINKTEALLGYQTLDVPYAGPGH